MTEISIRRCVLTIRRTSGWTWGADPAALLAAATRALPELLAARLPELTEDAPAVRVATPIRIHIATTARELAALADPLIGATTAFTLRERIAGEAARAVERAIAAETAEATGTTRETRTAHASDGAVAAGPDPAREPGGLAHEVRSAWRRGAFAKVLALLDEPALRTLHAAVLGDGAPPGAVSDPLRALAERMLVVVRAQHAADAGAAPAVAPMTATPVAEALRIRIALAAALLEAAPATAVEVRAAADAIAPLPADFVSHAARSAAPAAAEAQVSTTATVDVTPPAAAPRVAHPRVSGERELRSVLPFLLLRGLHDAGWLDTAGVLVRAGGLESSAFALAAGLAAKVLDPPERGWARTPADRLVAAAYAGASEPFTEADVAAAAARIAPVLAPLDAMLRARLARARAPRPLVLWRDAAAWTLVDGDGAVALARHGQLAPVLVAAYEAPILVPAAFAAPAVLEQIEFANRRFVSDAPRLRGEAWRVFAGVDRRLITNDVATPVPRLVSETAGIASAFALAAELVEVLGDRPAIAREPVSAFDSTCALAATAALADLGARLFPTEPTTPVLALTRFRDLDAVVHFEPDRVVVRVPLGRRHADLLSNGVLGTIAGAPWLGGRHVDLGGA